MDTYRGVQELLESLLALGAPFSQVPLGCEWYLSSLALLSHPCTLEYPSSLACRGNLADKEILENKADVLEIFHIKSEHPKSELWIGNRCCNLSRKSWLCELGSQDDLTVIQVHAHLRYIVLVDQENLAGPSIPCLLWYQGPQDILDHQSYLQSTTATKSHDGLIKEIIYKAALQCMNTLENRVILTKSSVITNNKLDHNFWHHHCSLKAL